MTPRLLDYARQQLRPFHPALAVSLLVLLLLTVGALVGLPLDARHILGLNPWIKPLKFDLSTLIFLFTIAILIAQLKRAYVAVGATRIWPRATGVVAWVIAIAMIVENVLISMQSFRGVRSHMNYTTVFDALVFATMGQFIALNTAALVILLLLYLDPRTLLDWPAAVNAGARVGLLILTVGSLEGVVMVVHGHHTVGAPDGGGGVPFLNWSTAHGDLRVPHFFAIHALQMCLLVGWVLSRTRLARGAQISGVCAFAAVYAAGCAWLFHLAMAGRPLFGI